MVFGLERGGGGANPTPSSDTGGSLCGQNRRECTQNVFTTSPGPHALSTDHRALDLRTLRTCLLVAPFTMRAVRPFPESPTARTFVESATGDTGPGAHVDPTTRRRTTPSTPLRIPRKIPRTTGSRKTLMVMAT